jgi:nanoRNase/pAp phosphatase (c-di-AMP/oligoRNAs hydrolase)
VEGLEQILIVLHDDPDPDAVASGAALAHLLQEVVGIEGTLVYRGVIGRAENRALVEYLGAALETVPDDAVVRGSRQQAIAVIDTQPGAGNCPVPAGSPTTIVIDHHSGQENDSGGFRDVRPWIGALSTILTQYLRAAEVKPPMKLATALFYGIKTDTKALSRDTSAADVAAYFYLLSFADIDALVEIENAQVPAAYFKNMNQAMQAARIYDGTVISYIGPTDYPDLTAEMADLFLRLEGVDWVVCLGVFEEILYLSVRAREDDADAEALAQEIIDGEGSAGGRNTLAGGQIPLDGRAVERVVEQIRRRALQYLQVSLDTVGAPLV